MTTLLLCAGAVCVMQVGVCIAAWLVLSLSPKGRFLQVRLAYLGEDLARYYYWSAVAAIVPTAIRNMVRFLTWPRHVARLFS
jgi:hypothetical protein